MQVFNDLEGLRIAVEMEKRGEDFYRRAARVSRVPETASMLAALADDEVLHGREFQRLHDAACADCGEDMAQAYDAETDAYLSAIAADIVFPGGLMALRGSIAAECMEDGRGLSLSPRAVLLHAIDSEKDSILFYTELAGCARSAGARATFLEIARQEHGHLARLMNRLAGLEAPQGAEQEG